MKKNTSSAMQRKFENISNNTSLHLSTISSLTTSNSTLAIHMEGRFGNTLFEIASGIAIAEHYKLNACIDDSDNYLYKEIKKAFTMLNNIPELCPKHIEEKIKTGDEIKIANRCCVYEDFNVSSSGTKMSLDELFGSGKNRNEEIYSLHSYLQSWKYLNLAPKAAQIHIKPEIVSSAKKHLENIVPNCKRVGIHMRVLDGSSPKEIYNYPGPEYFQKALQHFSEKWKCVKFLVFSDKPSWCQEQSIFDNEHVIIMDTVWKNEISIQKKAHQDFILMSVCDGVILSVGTFGWWAGYFSSQYGGEVVHFKNNFNMTRAVIMKQKVVEEDHFPPTWIGIEAPALERHGKWVGNLRGDILTKHHLEYNQTSTLSQP